MIPERRVFPGPPRRPDGGRIAFSHADCGALIEVDVRCAKGHPVSIEDVKAGLSRPARGH